MVLGVHVMCVKARFFEKIFLPPKWGNWTKNSFFFNILENLVIERCIRYIFASLFCMSKTQQFKNKEKMFFISL